MANKRETISKLDLRLEVRLLRIPAIVTADSGRS